MMDDILIVSMLIALGLYQIDDGSIKVGCVTLVLAFLAAYSAVVEAMGWAAQ